MEHHINGEGRKLKNMDDSIKPTMKLNVIEFRKKFMTQLSEWFWQLLEDHLANNIVAPVGQQQLTFIECTGQTAVKLFHAAVARRRVRRPAPRSPVRPADFSDIHTRAAACCTEHTERASGCTSPPPLARRDV